MPAFKFKHFIAEQDRATMKVGTDAMLLGAFIEGDGKLRGLDIGTGTGVLSLMLAQRNLELIIDALDIDSESVVEAKQNFNNSSWSERLNAYQQDVLSFHNGKNYDLIFSNPPFYQDSLRNVNLRKATTRHEAFLPLNELVAKVNELLSLNGNFWIIVPSENSEKWICACSKFNLSMIRFIEIYGKENDAVKRVIYCFSRQKPKPIKESFTIRTANGSYTQEYIELTKEFHDREL